MLVTPTVFLRRMEMNSTSSSWTNWRRACQNLWGSTGSILTRYLRSYSSGARRVPQVAVGQLELHVDPQPFYPWVYPRCLWPYYEHRWGACLLYHTNYRKQPACPRSRATLKLNRVNWGGLEHEVRSLGSVDGIDLTFPQRRSFLTTLSFRWRNRPKRRTVRGRVVFFPCFLVSDQAPCAESVGVLKQCGSKPNRIEHDGAQTLGIQWTGNSRHILHCFIYLGLSRKKLG